MPGQGRAKGCGKTVSWKLLGLHAPVQADWGGCQKREKTEAAHTALQPPPCPPHRNQSASGPVSGLAGEAACAASVQTPSRAVHSGAMSGLVLLTVAGAVPEWRQAGVPAVRGTGFPFQPTGNAGRSPESARILCHCRQRCRNGGSRSQARPGSPGKRSAPRSAERRSAHPHRPALIPRVRCAYPGYAACVPALSGRQAVSRLPPALLDWAFAPRSPGKRSAPGKCWAPQRASTPSRAHPPGALALTRATRRVLPCPMTGRKRR